MWARCGEEGECWKIVGRGLGKMWGEEGVLGVLEKCLLNVGKIVGKYGVS